MSEPIDPQADRSAFDHFGMEARLEARMLDPDKPVTEELKQAVLDEFRTVWDGSRRAGGKQQSREEIARQIGSSVSAITEVASGKYKADPTNILRKIDQYLADERIKLDRLDVRGFTPISLTHKIKGAIDAGIKLNKIPVIIGPPGAGKTIHARASVAQRLGAVFIEPDDFDCDERWVIDALYSAFGLSAYHAARREKKRAVVDYLRKHKLTLIVVDEAQKLTRGALEMLRRLHDLSDPTGRRNVSIVFLGDRDFYKLIVRARGGQRVPLTPQITRRMYPIFDIERHGCEFDKHGNAKAGTIYKRADIEAILRNQRVRVVRDDALDWLVRLANVSGHGSLGMAMLVMETAYELREGRLVTLDDLHLALTTVLGPDEADLVEEQAEHAAAQVTARAG